jgi:hypothetical protein
VTKASPIRLRDYAALFIAGLAVLLALRSCLLYLMHGAYAGVLVLLSLVGIAFVGVRSLRTVRDRFHDELKRLAAGTSALLAHRRDALALLAASGGRPDLSVLREATDAELEAEGYVGRYFVGVAILVGLIGTFLGMQGAFGTVGPLLADDAGSLTALAAPLTSVEVAFGASIVAILVTLSLSLLHGDVQLLQARLLAELDERTAHRLVPELWPADANTDKRVLLALSEISAALSRLEGTQQQTTEALVAELKSGFAAATASFYVRAAEAAVLFGDRASDAVSTFSARATEAVTAIEKGSLAATSAFDERSAQALLAMQKSSTAAVTTMEKTSADAIAAIEKSSAATVGALEQTSARTLTAIEKSTHATTTAMAEQTEEVLTTFNQRSSEAICAIEKGSQSATTAFVERTTYAVDTLSARAHDTITSMSERVAEGKAALDRVTELTAKALEDLGRGTAETLASTLENAATDTLHSFEAAMQRSQEHAQERLGMVAEQLSTALEQHTGRLGDAHVQAAEKLRDATAALSTAAEALRPVSEKLSAELIPEVRALSEQVALLATDAKDDELDAAIFTELTRLGSSVDALRAMLVRTEPSANQATYDSDVSPGDVVAEVQADA